MLSPTYYDDDDDNNNNNNNNYLGILSMFTTINHQFPFNQPISNIIPIGFRTSQNFLTFISISTHLYPNKNLLYYLLSMIMIRCEGVDSGLHSRQYVNTQNDHLIVFTRHTIQQQFPYNKN